MAPGVLSHLLCRLHCCKVRTQSDSGTSSHSAVGGSDTWKARQLLLLCDTHIPGGQGSIASAPEPSAEGWQLPKRNSCHPCSQLASGGRGSSGLDSSRCVSPLPMAAHSSNQLLSPKETEFNWATLLEVLDPVLGNPHSSTVLGRGNQLL